MGLGARLLHLLREDGRGSPNVVECQVVESGSGGESLAAFFLTGTVAKLHSLEHIERTEGLTR